MLHEIQDYLRNSSPMQGSPLLALLILSRRLEAVFSPSYDLGPSSSLRSTLASSGCPWFESAVHFQRNFPRGLTSGHCVLSSPSLAASCEDGSVQGGSEAW